MKPEHSYCIFLKGLNWVSVCWVPFNTLRSMSWMVSVCYLCVRVGNDVSEWFPVNVGSRQDCVMYPWLFHVYMDGVVREVNVRVLGKLLELLSANGGRFEINQPLVAEDTALVADSEEKLCRLVS